MMHHRDRETIQESKRDRAALPRHRCLAKAQRPCQWCDFLYVGPSPRLNPRLRWRRVPFLELARFAAVFLCAVSILKHHTAHTHEHEDPSLPPGDAARRQVRHRPRRTRVLRAPAGGGAGCPPSPLPPTTNTPMVTFSRWRDPVLTCVPESSQPYPGEIVAKWRTSKVRS